MRPYDAGAIWRFNGKLLVLLAPSGGGRSDGSTTRYSGGVFRKLDAEIDDVNQTINYQRLDACGSHVGSVTEEEFERLVAEGT